MTKEAHATVHYACTNTHKIRSTDTRTLISRRQRGHVYFLAPATTMNGYRALARLLARRPQSETSTQLRDTSNDLPELESRETPRLDTRPTHQLISLASPSNRATPSSPAFQTSKLPRPSHFGNLSKDASCFSSLISHLLPLPLLPQLLVPALPSSPSSPRPLFQQQLPANLTGTYFPSRALYRDRPRHFTLSTIPDQRADHVPARFNSASISIWHYPVLIAVDRINCSYDIILPISAETPRASSKMSVKFEQEQISTTGGLRGGKHEGLGHRIGERLTGGQQTTGYLAV